MLLIYVLISISFGQTVSLTLENDTFKYPGSDDDFTHGTGFEYVDNNFMHYKAG